MTTKFDVKDWVWTMHQDKPSRIQIQKITILEAGAIYDLGTEKAENEIFATKEELLDSFRDNE